MCEYVCVLTFCLLLSGAIFLSRRLSHLYFFRFKVKLAVDGTTIFITFITCTTFTTYGVDSGTTLGWLDGWLVRWLVGNGVCWK